MDDLLSKTCGNTIANLAFRGDTSLQELMYTRNASTCPDIFKMCNDTAKKAASDIQLSVNLVECLLLDSHWIEDYKREATLQLPTEIVKYVTFFAKQEEIEAKFQHSRKSSSDEKRILANKARTQREFKRLGHFREWKFAPIANGTECLDEIMSCSLYKRNAAESRIAGSIKGYEKFLYLLAKHGPRVPEELTHPSVCIDLIYHTHMIHPVAYHNDTIRLCGFMPDHEPWPTDEKTGNDFIV